MVIVRTLSKKDPEIATECSFEVEPDEGVKHDDPLELKSLTLNSDYYSLTWTALKRTQFIGVTFYKKDVFLSAPDYFWLYINFLTFFISIFVSIVLLIKEALLDDVYAEADIEMFVLRYIIVAFCQQLILPEFSQAYYKLIYGLQNKKLFTHPGFANFIALCQMFVSSTVLIGIILYVCMADEYIDPLTNSSGLCVLNELDNWIGDAIMSHKLCGFEINQKKRDEAELPDNQHNPDEGHHVHGHDHEEKAEKPKIEHKKSNSNDSHAHEHNDESNFHLKFVNQRLSLVNKLATISEDDLVIEIDDRIELNAHYLIVSLEKIVKILPWNIIIPLLTVPIGLYMPSITAYFRS